MRRVRVVGFALLLVLLLGGAMVFALAPAMVEERFNIVMPGHALAVSERAARLHAELFVADLHNDLLLWGRDPLDRAERGHTDLPRLRAGNVALQVFAAVTKSPRGLNYQRNSADSDSITSLAMVQRWPPATWTSLRARALHQASRLGRAAAADGKIELVRSAADLERFAERRRGDPAAVGTLLAIEGLHAIEGRMENLEALYSAGFRMMGLAHFFDNEVAGSAHGVEQGGLTEFGRAVVARMEELHALVDLAHASPRTIDDVLAIAKRPVVVSHTGVAATCPGPRNLTDDHLRRIAANGGLIGIGFWDGAVCGFGAEHVARAIRHAVAVAGIEHVALGSDFDGATQVPFDAAGLPQVTQALLDAGFTEPEIAAIMGGNAVRFLRANLP